MLKQLKTISLTRFFQGGSAGKGFNQVHAVCSFNQLLLQGCFLPLILCCLPASGGSCCPSSLIHVYSCTESLSSSHLLSPCLPLLLACHLASSSSLLSLSVVTPSSGPSLVFLSLPVLCLSHTNTPCAPADVVGNAKPLKRSHGGGIKPGAGKSDDRSPGSSSTKDTFVTTTKFSLLPGVSTVYSLFSIPTQDQTFKRADLWFRPHFGVPSETGIVTEWLSTKLFPPGISKDLGVRGG